MKPTRGQFRSLARPGIWLVLVLGFLQPCPICADVELVVGNINGTRGGTIAIPIQLAGATNIVGAQFDLVFPAAQFYTGYPFASSSGNGLIVLSAEVTNGVRRVLLYTRNNTPLTNGVLAYIPVTVKTNTPDSTAALYVSAITLARGDGTKEPLVFAGDGTLTIAPSSQARLGAVSRSNDGTIRFQVAGSDRATYAILASTNLSDWTAVTSVLTSAGLIDFSSRDATSFDRRFFRAVSQ